VEIHAKKLTEKEALARIATESRVNVPAQDLPAEIKLSIVRGCAEIKIQFELAIAEDPGKALKKEMTRIVKDIDPDRVTKGIRAMKREIT
jgi:hypothetical protein